MASAEYMEKYRAEHPERVKASVEGWRRRNPQAKKNSAKATWYRTTFGLTISEVETLIARQRGVCAICGNAETLIGTGGKVRELCIDHCHATGTIRGMLCSACNGMLGYARDNLATLRAAAVYLEVANTGFKMPPAPSIEEVNALLEELKGL